MLLLWLVSIMTSCHNVYSIGYIDQIGHRECAIDLGIAVDDSSSVLPEEFLKMKEFLYRIIENIGPSRDGAHISTMFFSYDTRILFNFKDEAGHNRFSARSAISSYQPKGGKTCTENALIHSRTDMFKQDQIRPGISQVLLLIGDGGSNCNWDYLYKSALDLKNAGVTIITVGIGYDVNYGDLKAIATSSEHVFEFASIDGAIGTVERILRASCRTQLKVRMDPYIAPVYNTLSRVPFFNRNTHSHRMMYNNNMYNHLNNAKISFNETRTTAVPYGCIDAKDARIFYKGNLFFVNNDNALSDNNQKPIKLILKDCLRKALENSYNSFVVNVHGNCYGNSINNANSVDAFLLEPYMCNQPNILGKPCNSNNDFCLGGSRSLFLYKVA